MTDSEIGKLRSTAVEAREVSRMLNDAEVVKRNLEQALARYEQLLAKAANVAEATALEEALMRVRTQLDRVKSDLEWSRDRVARSIVYVTLNLASTPEAVEPVAKFYPGLRAALLWSPHGRSRQPRAFAGAGVSLRLTRSFDIDVDLLKDLSRSSGSAVDFYLVTLGAAFYSDYFGGGKRTALNPYFGFRTGYARAPGRSLVPLGATLGIELYKSDRVLLGFDARVYAMSGARRPRLRARAALGLNIAYGRRPIGRLMSPRHASHLQRGVFPERSDAELHSWLFHLGVAFIEGLEVGALLRSTRRGRRWPLCIVRRLLAASAALRASRTSNRLKSSRCRAGAGGGASKQGPWARCTASGEACAGS